MTQELKFLAEDVTELDLELTRANFHNAKEREAPIGEQNSKEYSCDFHACNSGCYFCQYTS